MILSEERQQFDCSSLLKDCYSSGVVDAVCALKLGRALWISIKLAELCLSPQTGRCVLVFFITILFCQKFCRSNKIKVSFLQEESCFWFISTKATVTAKDQHNYTTTATSCLRDAYNRFQRIAFPLHFLEQVRNQNSQQRLEYTRIRQRVIRFKHVTAPSNTVFHLRPWCGWRYSNCSRGFTGELKRVSILWCGLRLFEVFTPPWEARASPQSMCGTSVQRFQSIKLTIELPEHPNNKVPQRLWLAVLLNPAENACGEFLETAHWHRITERLEQGVHDALKDVELHLVRHLILSVLWVVLVGLHYVLIVRFHDLQCHHFFS